VFPEVNDTHARHAPADLGWFREDPDAVAAAECADVSLTIHWGPGDTVEVRVLCAQERRPFSKDDDVRNVGARALVVACAVDEGIVEVDLATVV
jgi:hypothetical protein